MTSEPDVDSLTLSPVTQRQHGFIARYPFPILLTGMACASFSPIFIRLSDVGPIATAADRLLGSLPLFFLLLWLRPQDRIPLSTATGRRDLWFLILAGVFFAFNQSLWNWAATLTSIATGTVLANITPVFVVIAGWILFKDKPRPLFLVGMALALAGSTVMIGESSGISKSALIGDILAVASAACFAGYVLTLSRVRQRVSIAATMAFASATAGVITFMIAWFTEDALLPHSAHGWAVAIGMTVLVQICGQMLIATSLAHVSAGLVALALLSIPVIPAIAAWVLFGEAITLYQVVGTAMIWAGLEVSRRASNKP